MEITTSARVIDKISIEFVTDTEEVSFPDLILEPGIYNTGDYCLELTKTDHIGISFSRIDEKDFTLKKVSYCFGFPLHNPAKIIVPDTGRHFMDTLFPRQVMAKARFLSSAAKMSSPFMEFLDSTETVTLAFGLTGKMVDSEFILESPGANAKYSLVVKPDQWRWRINKPFDDNVSLGKMTSFRDGFYISSGDKSWYHALRSYGKVYRKANNVNWNNTNTNTYKPQFCTWRVVNSDNLTHDWTIATAKECKKLGIGVMILDDGWFGVGLDSDTMESDLGNWPSKIKGKYENITQTLKAIKQEGLDGLLWFCPLGLGPQSEISESLEKYCIKIKGEPYITPGLFKVLCTRNPDARTVMVQMLRKVLSYLPDGFKPDLFNYQPIESCTADHDHDIPNSLEALRECMRLMHEEASSHDPNLNYMLKNDEANVDFAQFAPAVRSGDSPYDPNIMFLRCAYANAIAPAVINDYLMIGQEESEKEIAYCLIKQLTMGVPAISIDILNASYEQRAVLKAWLSLYNDALKEIHINGMLEPQNSSLTCWQRTDKTNECSVLSVIHPCNCIEVFPESKKTFVLNASSCDKVFIHENQIKSTKKVETFNYMHNLAGKYNLVAEDNEIRVPAAGYAVISDL